MNMFEEAKTLRDMVIMCHMTQSEIADKLNVSQSYIANKIRLLQLPEDVREGILKAKLSERHARALLRLNGEEQKTALARIADGHFTVATSEAVIDGILDQKRLDALKAAGESSNLSLWEDAVDASLTLLRKQGLAVEKKTEKFGKRIYYTIAVG